MTQPPRRTPDLRVQITAREPDDVLLARLTSLARASGEAAALADRGPARWKVALAAASVAAIATGGAALADALTRTDPSPVAPPPGLPTNTEREREPSERDRDPDDRPMREEKPPGSGSEVGFGGPADPVDEPPAAPPEEVATPEDDDESDGPDDTPDDDPDDDSGDQRDDSESDDSGGDEGREDELGEREEPEDGDEADDSDADEPDTGDGLEDIVDDESVDDPPGGSRDD